MNNDNTYNPYDYPEVWSSWNEEVWNSWDKTNPNLPEPGKKINKVYTPEKYTSEVVGVIRYNQVRFELADTFPCPCCSQNEHDKGYLFIQSKKVQLLAGELETSDTAPITQELIWVACLRCGCNGPAVVGSVDGAVLAWNSLPRNLKLVPDSSIRALLHNGTEVTREREDLYEDKPNRTLTIKVKPKE